jgi:hypothetical protein
MKQSPDLSIRHAIVKKIIRKIFEYVNNHEHGSLLKGVVTDYTAFSNPLELMVGNNL